MRDCVNLNIPHFKVFAFQFGEIALSNALDKFPSDTIPSFKELYESSKKELGVLSKAEAKRQLGVNTPTNASTFDIRKLHKRIGEVNNQNFSNGVDIKYRTVNVFKQGQSDIHSWDVQRIERKLNMLSKIERVESKLVDPQDSITELERLKKLQEKEDKKNEDPQGKLFAINPNEDYSSVTVATSFDGKQQMLDTFNIKRSKSHYFYTLTPDEQKRVDSYLKKSGTLGATRLGFTISDDPRGVVSYKLTKGKGYLYIDIKDIVDTGGIKMRKIVGRIKIPIDLVFNKEEKEYLKNEKEGTIYIPYLQREINKELFKVKGISPKRSANFYLLQVKSLIINATKDFADDITFQDLDNLKGIEIYQMYKKLNLEEAITKIVDKIKLYLAALDIEELKSEIIDLYKSHFDPQSLGGFEDLLDLIPKEFLKLITFNYIDMENASFSQESSKNKHQFDGLAKLASLDGMQKAMALNVALRNMLNDGLIDLPGLDEANKMLKPQIEEYINFRDFLNRASQEKLEDPNGTIKSKFIKKRKTLLSAFNRVKYPGFKENFLKYWDEAEQQVREASADKNQGLVDLISVITKKVGNLNSVFSEVSLGSISQVGRKFKIDNLTIAMHELGHGLDMYLQTTNPEAREHIYAYIHDLINHEEFENYLKEGLLSRGYKVSNINEITADMYAWIMGVSIGYDMSRGHLASMDEFFHDHWELANSIYEKHFPKAIQHATVDVVSNEPFIVRLMKDILNSIIQKINDLFNKKVFNTLPYYGEEKVTLLAPQFTGAGYNLGNMFDHMRKIIFDSSNFDIENILNSESQQAFRTMKANNAVEDGTIIKECKL